MLDHLFELKGRIEKDLKVCADVEDNAEHLKALDSVETLIGYLL